MQISVNVHLDAGSLIEVHQPWHDEKRGVDVPLTVKLRAASHGDPVTLFLRGDAAKNLARALTTPGNATAPHRLRPDVDIDRVELRRRLVDFLVDNTILDRAEATSVAKSVCPE